jgi:DNA-binding GntR family transcriptional regulator
MTGTMDASDTGDPAPQPKGRAEPRKGQLRLEALHILRKKILQGELPPGQRLREVAVSQEFGMSRTPIREAFHMLAAEGLLNLLPNRSVVVSVPDKSEAADVFMVLGTLEALAAELACRRMSAAQLEKLEELQEDLATYFEQGDRLSYLEANRLIHEHIVEASNSPALILAWRLLLPRAERARHVSTLDHVRWADAFEEHRKIADAIQSRDETLARQLLESHFANGVESMKKNAAKDRARRRSAEYANRD